jgi:Bacteroidetes-specific putative membrane protein
MKRGIYILLVLLLCNIAGVKAQFESQISQYWAVPNFFNPGYAGSNKGKLDISAFARLQWIGVEGAPRTTMIMAEMPMTFLGREHGVGAVVYNDQIGLFSNSVMGLQYAYKQKIGKGTLSIGLQGGYVSSSFKADSINVPDQEGAINLPSGALSGNTIDLGAGIYFSTKKFYVGLSAMHIVAPNLELNERYAVEIPRSYYFTAGYNIQLNNPLLELHPSVLVKAVEPSNIKVEADSTVQIVEKGDIMKAMWKQTQIDVSLRFTYNKMLWIGASWRGATFDRGESAVVMIGGKFKSFALGYSFDYPLSPIGSSTWGSHELFLKYILDMDNKKKRSKKHKSVRIL